MNNMISDVYKQWTDCLGCSLQNKTWAGSWTLSADVLNCYPDFVHCPFCFMFVSMWS
jgi:hypothetical protein